MFAAGSNPAWPMGESKDEVDKMPRKRPDFDRSMEFDLMCPGNPDPKTEGKRRFRESLHELMALFAEWIADSEEGGIESGKNMETESGFPLAITLDIDHSVWTYLLTLKANSKVEQQEREHAR